VKRVILRTVLIIAWSVGTALVWNATRSQGLPLTEGGVLSILAEKEGFACIMLPEAKEKYDAGAIFIDARPMDEQDEGTIFGAFSLPAPAFDEWYPEIEMQVPPIGVDHVIFCSGGTCTDSIDVAKGLRERGFEQVFVMEEGYEAWLEQGYPTGDPMPRIFGDGSDAGTGSDPGMEPAPMPGEEGL